MTKAELLALADSCEAAPPEQQRELLGEAWRVINPDPGDNLADVPPWIDYRNRFTSMLWYRAYESAALSMMPEGWYIAQVSDIGGKRGYLAVLHRRPVPQAAKGGNASTLALALEAAILRARAEEIE